MSLNYKTATSHATAAAATFSYSSTHPGPDFVELPVLRERACYLVEEAIQAMPPEERAAYMEACVRCPSLVAKESDVLKFIRCCDYDHREAAGRICSYWKERLSVFGPDRAFLPLIITGDGALTEEDVNSLHAGFPALLPNNTNGQSVILFDRRKWLPNATTENKLRCMFYMAHIAAQNELSQTEGVITLVVLVPPRLLMAPDPQDYHRRVTHLIKIMPVKCYIHLAALSCPSKTHVLQDIFSTMLECILERTLKAEVHIAREKGQLVDELQEIGMTPQGIPTCIGGKWTFDLFFTWLRKDRMVLERREYKSNSKALINGSSGSGSALGGEGSCAACRTKRAPLTAAEKKEKRRMVDLIHSRRKRARKRQEIAKMKQQSSQLMMENLNLKARRDQLESLLKQAHDIVARKTSSL